MSSDVQVVRHASAQAFSERAGPFLLAAEAEHNLLLGIVAGLAALRSGLPPDVLLATVERDGAVVGAVFRTPPFKLGLTPMPAAAVAPVADHVLATYGALPAVMGPPDVARAVAEIHARRTGRTARPGMRQRIHRLERVRWPARAPAGRIRPARADDLGLLIAWVREFETEAGVPVVRGPAEVEALVQAGALALWDDGGAAALAGVMGRTPQGARIGLVYTPPARRRRGYAAALTAALSQQVLDGGARFCCLFTDLANPTSNALYHRIGYEPVCDVMDYEFGG